MIFKEGYIYKTKDSAITGKYIYYVDVHNMSDNINHAEFYKSSTMKSHLYSFLHLGSVFQVTKAYKIEGLIFEDSKKLDPKQFA